MSGKPARLLRVTESAGLRRRFRQFEIRGRFLLLAACGTPKPNRLLGADPVHLQYEACEAFEQLQAAD